MCQETDGQFCAENKWFLLYYYVPVSVFVVLICQMKNYKQVSYIAKLAMIATAVALGAIMVDAAIQIMMYFRVDYADVEQQSELKLIYEQNNGTKDINIWLPVFPYFLDCFCKIQVCFEGAPIVPRLYSNAQNKHFFVRNINRAVLYLGLFQAFMGVICVLAYGNRLQEVVLMNLYYGVFSQFVKLMFAFGMIVNLSL